MVDFRDIMFENLICKQLINYSRFQNVVSYEQVRAARAVRDASRGGGPGTAGADVATTTTATTTTAAATTTATTNGPGSVTTVHAGP